MSSLKNNAEPAKDENDNGSSNNSKTLLAGMPPISDDPTMKFLLGEIRAMKEKMAYQEIESVQQKEEIAQQKTEMAQQKTEIAQLRNKSEQQEETIKNLSLGFKGRYVSAGGDTCFYSNLGTLRNRLRAACGNDREMLKKFDQWAKERNFKGNVRVGLTMLGGAVSGAVVVGAVTVALHCGLVAGAATVGVAGALHCGLVAGAATGGVIHCCLVAGAATAAGIAGGTATLIVLGCTAFGLLIVFIGWGIYKLYHKHQLKKVKADDLTQEEKQMLQNFNINALFGAATNAQ